MWDSLHCIGQFSADWGRRPAAAIHPSDRAFTRASLSTMGPRAQLIRQAVGFIRWSCASPIM